MTTDKLRFKLTTALTEYDRKQSTRKYYNRFALGHYMCALEDVMCAVESGVPVSTALSDRFSDRVLSVCQKAIEGEPCTY